MEGQSVGDGGRYRVAVTVRRNELATGDFPINSQRLGRPVTRTGHRVSINGVAPVAAHGRIRVQRVAEQIGITCSRTLHLSCGHSSTRRQSGIQANVVASSLGACNSDV